MAVHHQAASRQHPGARELRCGRTAGQLRVRRRFQHRRLRLLGADGGGPRARPCRGTVPRAACAATMRAPSTPTTRRPAPSAASACRRRPSHTRRCSTISRRKPASTASSSATSTRCAPATRRPPARCSKPAPGWRRASTRCGRAGRCCWPTPPRSTPAPAPRAAASASAACGTASATPASPTLRPCG